MAQETSISLGRVIGKGFDALIKTPSILLLAILFVGLPSFAAQYWTMQLALRPPSPEPFANFWLFVPSIAQLFVSLVANGLLCGFVTRSVIRRLRGLSADSVGSIRSALPMAFPMVALSLVAGAIVIIGLIFLIVPGIILSLVLIVAVPVMVTERTGVIASMIRSEALTSGSKGMILLLSLFLYVVALVFTAFLSLFGWAAIDIAPAGYVAPALTGAVAEALTASVSAPIIASLYVELRTFKEGSAEDALVDVFE